MSYNGSEGRLCLSMFLACCLLPNKFHEISLCCDFLNSPELFRKSQGFNMMIIIINTAIWTILQ